VALPQSDEEADPAFHHFPARQLPLRDTDGVRVRLIAGEAFGLRSPVQVFSRMFYVDATCDGGAMIELPIKHGERAAHVVEGSTKVEGRAFAEGTLLVFIDGEGVKLRARNPSRIALLGGAPLESQRHIWWNFVASSPGRIERAKREWADGKFPPVPGETAFIPLPAH
jgi:redox-sensitive bicupin YhaK (pirin superfamily)